MQRMKTIGSLPLRFFMLGYILTRENKIDVIALVCDEIGLLLILLHIFVLYSKILLKFFSVSGYLQTFYLTMAE